MRTWPSVSCPTCNAGPYEACRTRSNERTAQHKTRPVGNLGGRSKPITRQIETLVLASYPTNERDEEGDAEALAWWRSQQ